MENEALRDDINQISEILNTYADMQNSILRPTYNCLQTFEGRMILMTLMSALQKAGEVTRATAKARIGTKAIDSVYLEGKTAEHVLREFDNESIVRDAFIEEGLLDSDSDVGPLDENMEIHNEHE